MWDLHWLPTAIIVVCFVALVVDTYRRTFRGAK